MINISSQNRLFDVESCTNAEDTGICVCVCLHVCVCVCVCVCGVCACVCVRVCLWCMCLCLCVCVCVYLCSCPFCCVFVCIVRNRAPDMNLTHLPMSIFGCVCRYVCLLVRVRVPLRV